MATNANLPPGASITSIDGRRCTAVPKAANAVGGGEPAATSSSSTSSSTSTTSTPTQTATEAEAPPPPPPLPPPPPVANPIVGEEPTTTEVAPDTSTSTTSSTSPSVISDTTPVPGPTQTQVETSSVEDSPALPSTTPTEITENSPSPTDPPPLSPLAESETLAEDTATQTDEVAAPTTTSDVQTSTPTSSDTTDATDSTTEPVPTTGSDTTDATDSTTEPVPTTGSDTTDATDSTTEPDPTTGSDTTPGGGAFITTTGTTPTGSPFESETAGAGLDGTSEAATGNAISTQTTIAVAGGVIGGLAAISLVGFLIWFWRKRRMQKRRSTLLTPLSTDPTFRDNEKGPYVINRTSLGPTPFPEKFREVVGYNYKRIKQGIDRLVGSPNPSVDLDRGNSQFGPLDTPTSRSSSRARESIQEPLTAKGRFVDWWGRLTEDANFNWKLGNEPKSNRSDNDPFMVRRSIQEPNPTAASRSQPDFLTLLNVDDQEMGREGSRGRTSVNNTQRRSASLGEGHFLGGLGLNFDTVNPFSDANAVNHDPAKGTTRNVAAADNPFLDSNAITAPSLARQNSGPTTYVQNVRRSRGHSVSVPGNRPPSDGRMESIYRESGASIDSFGARRNKFRSDPFDLDRPELLTNGSSAVDVARGNSRASRDSRGIPHSPQQAHVRNSSFTSKYSSGATMSDWSEPGPDVGPAIGRYNTPATVGASGKRIGVERVQSGVSQGSVGKAL